MRAHLHHIFAHEAGEPCPTCHEEPPMNLTARLSRAILFAPSHLLNRLAAERTGKTDPNSRAILRAVEAEERKRAGVQLQTGLHAGSVMFAEPAHSTVNHP